MGYKGTKHALPGCWNDGFNMKNYLSKKGFSVTWMNDNKSSQNALYPSKSNMQTMIKNLVANASYGDVLWLGFSGHGIQKDTGGLEEFDKKDEAIAPTDHASHGFIEDDWFRQEFVDKIPEGVEVVAMFDCCHSGTMMDLPYNFKNGQFRKTSNPTTNLPDNSSVLYLSGCRDHEVSREHSQSFNRKRMRGGMLTFSFLELVRVH